MEEKAALREPLPDTFDSLDGFWRFWDMHSSADYEDLMTPVDVEIDLLGEQVSSISNASSLEEMGAFWDTHDFTEFGSNAPDVEFEITCAVLAEVHLPSSVEKQARQREEK